MREQGFIKLHRSIVDWRWYKDINTCHLFMHLLLMANFTDADFRSHTIKRGQLVTSLSHLSEQTGLSVQQVRTALNHLKSTNDVTIKSTSKYTIITIENYETDELSTQTSTNNQQRSNKQSTNNQQQYNKDNKDKKNKKGINNHFVSDEKRDDYIAIFESKSLFTD